MSEPTLSASSADQSAKVDHTTLFLYATTLFAWGTSWYALKINANAAVSPEISLVYRFGLAATVMIGWVIWGRHSLKFPWRLHVRFAAMGVALFSFNFLAFYYASLTLPSGLLAVIFSSVSVMIVLASALVFRQPLNIKVLLAILAGVSGIGMIFWPEIEAQNFERPALIALLLCFAGNCLFCVGNLLSARIQRDGVSVIPANTICMMYGAAIMAVFALFRGQPYVFEWSVPYVGSMMWLATFSSVAAFAAYLTLLGRIGPGRAGYLTIAFPLIALAISTALEGFQWTPLAVAGLILVLAGNYVVLKK